MAKPYKKYHLSYNYNTFIKIIKISLIDKSKDLSTHFTPSRTGGGGLTHSLEDFNGSYIRLNTGGTLLTISS